MKLRSWKRLSWLRVLVVAIVAACIASRGLEWDQTQQATTIPLQNFDFGSVKVTQTSADHKFTISPASGEQSDKIDSLSYDCPDFKVTPSPTPATVNSVCTSMGSGGGCTGYTVMTYTFTASFTPRVTGMVSCVVTISIDSAPTQLTLFGTGTEPPKRIAVSPSASQQPLDLGQVRIGDVSNPTPVTVTNFGSGPAALSISSVAFGASDTPPFKVTGNVGQHVLASGASEGFTVTCAPTAEVGYTGTLTIKSDDPANPSATVVFECSGIVTDLVFDPHNPAQIAGSQTNGATRVGEPIDIPVTLSTIGPDLAIESLTVAGDDLTLASGPPANTTITASTPVDVHLTFGATTERPQGVIGTLAVKLSDGSAPTLTITGAALATSMSVSPDGTVDLGPICVNSMRSQPFIVMKNNPGTFALTDIAPPAAPFSLAGSLPTAGVPVNVTDAVSFTATAAPLAPGAVRSSFAITTDIPNATPHTVMLQATGLPTGVTATPASIDFGVATVAQSSVGQTVSLTNCNGAPLALTDAILGGPNAGDFTIVLQPTSSSIAAGESATYTLVLQPHARGARSATLQIDYDGGSATVQLLGTGIGGPDDPAPPSATYYTCSTGGAGSGSPVVLALALLGWRRRRQAPRK